MIEPIRHQVEVEVDADTAFRVFTERMGAWWPAEHVIGDEPKADLRVEPGVGGRLLEIGESGAECQSGTVLAWEPGARLVVAWQITTEWRPEPDLERSSEYEVTFRESAPGRTIVTVEHRHLERHGDGWHGMAAAVDGPQGWPYVLEGFRAHVGPPAS